jgi:hypothetical protein
MRRHWLPALALATSLSATGCQVLWASITSPSDWASGLSTSMSGSVEGLSRSSGSPAGGSDLRSAFRQDVRILTAASAERGPLDGAFVRDVSRLALRHGIDDWEREPDALVAIGAGLRQAGVPEGELEAVLARIGRTEARDRTLVREGFREASL